MCVRVCARVCACVNLFSCQRFEMNSDFFLNSLLLLALIVSSFFIEHRTHSLEMVPHGLVLD